MIEYSLYTLSSRKNNRPTEAPRNIYVIAYWAQDEMHTSATTFSPDNFTQTILTSTVYNIKPDGLEEPKK